MTPQTRRLVATAAAATAAAAALVAAPPASAASAPALPQAARSAPTAGVPPAATPILIERVLVLGNTLLPQPALDAALVALRGPQPLAAMQRAAADVQALYAAAGFAGVVAFLPEQSLADGVLRIQVLEGRVATVTVTGADRPLGADAVRRALPALAEGTTPDVRRLDRQVQLANENPSRRLALTLEESRAPGEIDVRVNVAETDPRRWSASLDNTGNAATGRLRLGLGWSHAALFGGDHRLALQAGLAPEKPGAVAVLAAHYERPLPAAGLMLQAYALRSDVDAGSTATPAGALSFSGQGRVAGLRVNAVLPRWKGREQRLALALDRRDHVNACAIEGLPAGACGSAGESVRVQPLTLEYSVQQQRGGDAAAWVLSATRNWAGAAGSRGDAARFDRVRPGAPAGWGVLRVSGFLARNAAGDTAAAAAAGPAAAVPAASSEPGRWSARISAQFGPHALVPGEQFGLGGAASVRGYEEREISADAGLSLGLEWTSPPLRAPWAGGADPAAASPDSATSGAPLLRSAVFADAGWAANRLQTPCDATRSRCRLASVGAGLRFALGATDWRLDLAQPLAAGRDGRRHGPRLHLMAQLSL